MVAPCPPFHGVVDFLVKLVKRLELRILLIVSSCRWIIPVLLLGVESKNSLKAHACWIAIFRVVEIKSTLKLCVSVWCRSRSQMSELYWFFFFFVTLKAIPTLIATSWCWRVGIEHARPGPKKRSECWQRGGCRPVWTFDKSSGLLEVEWFPHHLNWFFSEWVI